MAIKEKIFQDLKAAMIAKDEAKLLVLRGINSTLNNRAIDKRTKTGDDKLTEGEIIETLFTEAKKRKEAIAQFQSGNRADLAEKEAKELSIIQAYLPAQLSAEETEKQILDFLKKHPDLKNFGDAMKEVMKEFKGKADAGLISKIIKGQLG